MSEYKLKYISKLEHGRGLRGTECSVPLPCFIQPQSLDSSLFVQTLQHFKIILLCFLSTSQYMGYNVEVPCILQLHRKQIPTQTIVEYSGIHINAITNISKKYRADVISEE